MSIAVIGAGAFGAALAITWAQSGQDVTLWGRDADVMNAMQTNRKVPRLPDVSLPAKITCSANLDIAFTQNTIALALPAQAMRPFLETHKQALSGKSLIACCKGIDLTTMTGPVSTIRQIVPDANAAMLTGPSFAADIAKGLPTALTLAISDDAIGTALQTQLSTPTLRIYRATDTIGAELGGALKNVMAIACGVAIGAGLGDSARAALMTRGFSEMLTLADKLGAERATLGGLSGFGDLVLTCTSTQSRNFRYGQSLARETGFDKTTTVEGAATAKSVTKLAKSLELDLPICTVVADLIDAKTDVSTALEALMARPLKEE
ncbi:NAD(P)-dependent glycerol-3-phosphate dehydrogenase [Loktanella sp. F6476L]|uniref:NAD(P)H-dependent glycerol-3-phosphate dehydrogenase n=1 Tax=Loktanella sp. F6476L TaxID=2926405 RepID=UPI001FF3C7D5|nr:NAD(P)H-dependent glycerol-3-phosphate dehydrogenase [Loktanella sp. F6476L]MCK0120730.1 NAD(P)-dependent glycerol-3-phosphate dehydrogenase [Loktanella sp. F6476L]